MVRDGDKWAVDHDVRRMVLHVQMRRLSKKDIIGACWIPAYCEILSVDARMQRVSSRTVFRAGVCPIIQQ